MVEPQPISKHVAEIIERAKAAAPTTEQDDLRPRTLADVRMDRFAAEVPLRFRAATLGDLPGNLRTNIIGWLNSTAPTLLLSGGVGTGKTHAAWATIREAVDRGHSVSGVTVPDLLDSLRPDGDRLRVDADILLLDDLGGERATEWAVEQIWRVLDRRTRDGLRQVVTTNSGPTELLTNLGPRVTSRLLGGATVVRFDGPDQRQARW